MLGLICFITPHERAADLLERIQIYVCAGPVHAHVPDEIADEISRCMDEGYAAGYRAGQRNKRARAREAADRLDSAIDAVLDEMRQGVQRTPPGSL